LAGSSKPLLDHVAAKVGVDQTAFRACDGLAQFRVCDVFFPSKPLKRLVQEYPQSVTAL